MTSASRILRSEKGALSLIILILLLLGIAVGVYLVTSKNNFFTQFFPKAGGGVGVFWVDDQGDETLESTTDTTLRVRLAPPWPYANVIVDDPVESAEAELDEKLDSQTSTKDKKIKMIRIKGRFIFPKGVRADKLPDPPTIFSICTDAKVVYSKDRRKFAFEVPEKSSFCVQASNPKGYVALAINAKQGPSSFYIDQVAGIDCSKKKVSCDTKEELYDLANDKKYDFLFNKAAPPTPSPTPEEVKTIKVVIAENPNFSTNVVELTHFNLGSNIIDYPFSDPTPGTKLVYAKFIANSGEEQVFSDSVDLVTIPSPTPTPVTYPFSINKNSVEDTIDRSISTLGPGIIITNNSDSTIGVVITNNSNTAGVGLNGGSTAILPGKPLIVESTANNNSIPDGVYTGESLIRYSVNNGPYQDGPTIPFSITVLGGSVSPSPTSTPTSTPTGRFVQVTYPNGGENLNVGDKVKITWDANDIDSCWIAYSFGPGSTNWIITGLPCTNTRSYEWTVNVGNMLLGTQKQVKIKIIAYKTGVGSVQDESDDFFTVVNP